MKTIELKKEAFYPHPPEMVWAALTNGEAIAQWLMPNNFRAEVGTRFNFQVDFMPKRPHIVECEVLAMEAPKRMVWSWMIVSSRQNRVSPTMQIEWTLIAKENGTLLQLRQTGAEKIGLIHRLMMSFGWGTMLNRWLPKVLGGFTRLGDEFRYQRLEPAPNRGHHTVRSVPDSYFK